MANYFVLDASSGKVLKDFFTNSNSVAVKTPNDVALDYHGFAAPWEVRYSASLSAWLIYIPSGSLVKDNSYALENSLISSLTAAGGTYPSGWYNTGISVTAATWTNICLIIDESSASPTATLGTSASGSQYAITLAQAYSAASPSLDKKVRQIARSVITLGGAGSPAASLPEPFDIVGGKVVRCEIYCPDDLATCDDYTIVNPISDIYLHIDRSTGGYTITVNQTSRANTATHLQYRLYRYVNGALECDQRPKIAPVFAL